MDGELSWYKVVGLKVWIAGYIRTLAVNNTIWIEGSNTQRNLYQWLQQRLATTWVEDSYYAAASNMPKPTQSCNCDNPKSALPVLEPGPCVPLSDDIALNSSKSAPRLDGAMLRARRDKGAGMQYVGKC